MYWVKHGAQALVNINKLSGPLGFPRCFPRPITAWIVLECLWDLYFTELAIYLAHLLLHQVAPG